MVGGLSAAVTAAVAGVVIQSNASGWVGFGGAGWDLVLSSRRGRLGQPVSQQPAGGRDSSGGTREGGSKSLNWPWVGERGIWHLR